MSILDASFDSASTHIPSSHSAPSSQAKDLFRRVRKLSYASGLGRPHFSSLGAVSFPDRRVGRHSLLELRQRGIVETDSPASCAGVGLPTTGSHFSIDSMASSADSFVSARSANVVSSDGEWDSLPSIEDGSLDRRRSRWSSEDPQDDGNHELDELQLHSGVVGLRRRVEQAFQLIFKRNGIPSSSRRLRSLISSRNSSPSLVEHTSGLRSLAPAFSLGSLFHRERVGSQNEAFRSSESLWLSGGLDNVDSTRRMCLGGLSGGSEGAGEVEGLVERVTSRTVEAEISFCSMLMRSRSREGVPLDAEGTLSLVELMARHQVEEQRFMHEIVARH